MLGKSHCQADACLRVLKAGGLHGGVDIPAGNGDPPGLYAGSKGMDRPGIGAARPHNVPLDRNFPGLGQLLQPCHNFRVANDG